MNVTSQICFCNQILRKKKQNGDDTKNDIFFLFLLKIIVEFF